MRVFRDGEFDQMKMALMRVHAELDERGIEAPFPQILSDTNAPILQSFHRFVENNPHIFKTITVGQLVVPALWHGMSKENYDRFLASEVYNRVGEVPKIPRSSAGGADLLGPGWYFTPVLKEAFGYMNAGVPKSERKKGKILLCIMSPKKDFQMAVSGDLRKNSWWESKAAHEKRIQPFIDTPDILLHKRILPDESVKFKMANHVDRKYMIVLVFNCTDVQSGAELTLDVKETMRLMPDGWQEMFDPALGATITSNQRLPISHVGVRTDRIITYNLCFGCMSGVKNIAYNDNTGGEFAKACAMDENMSDLNGTRVSKCLLHAAANLNELGARYALFIGLQELANPDTVKHLIEASTYLNDFQVFLHECPLDNGVPTYICALVAPDLRVIEQCGGCVEPGRGWQMLFCEGRDTHFLLVNLHNKHNDPGLATLKRELDNNYQRMPQLHAHLSNGSPIDVYVVGDLNTKKPYDRKVTLKPFDVYNLDVTLKSSGTKNTCCDARLRNGNIKNVEVERERGHSHIADHVLATSDRTAVPTYGGRTYEASDHLPVCVDVECITSKSVPGATISMRRSADVTD